MKLTKAIAVDKNDAINSILEVLDKDFNFKIDNGQKDRLSSFINSLVDGLFFVFEYPYVDKVFRDCYYSYYSMKNYPYKRDSLKVGVFAGEISQEKFTAENKQFLQNIFRGFFIIRPTAQIMGRNVLSPMVFKNTTVLICETSYKVTICHLEFEVKGFPHSSQDTETMTCGETTIWSLLEYYGNKKPHYKTTLPSTINTIINEASHERRLPSDGVGLNQMSYAVKKLGFSSKLYAKDHYKEEFYELLSCYIESGIPVISIIENHSKGDDHAILCIGHEVVSVDVYNKYWIKRKIGDLDVFDNDLVPKKFVFIDDNTNPYQKSFLFLDPYIERLLDNKLKEQSFIKYKISHFIVPLHQKIFLDAHYAKAFIKVLITEGPQNMRLKKENEYVVRLLLTTGRSYKRLLVENHLISNLYVTEIILETPFPNFIWLAEISTRELYVKNKKANGLVIIDATEADTSPDRSILFACLNNNIMNNIHEEKMLAEPFECDIYQHNLAPD